MISREGVLSTFHRPSSRLSLRAANSNRAAWASQGLISCSRVTDDIKFSNLISCRHRRWVQAKQPPASHRRCKASSGYPELFFTRPAVSCLRLGGWTRACLPVCPNPSESRPGSAHSQAKLFISPLLQLQSCKVPSVVLP